MNYRCFIIDDSPEAISVLENHISKISFLELIGTETDPALALEKILTGQVIADVVFLDVEMPGINGIEIAEQISEICDVIFVTGHDQYARNAYDFDLIDHLAKPVMFARFFKTAQKIKNHKQLTEMLVQKSAPELLPIKKERKGQYDFVNIRNVLYIEAAGNYSKFILSENHTLISYQSLVSLETRLFRKRFLRVHKKTIVNMDKIKRLSGARIEMSNGDVIAIGSSYMEAFLSQIR